MVIHTLITGPTHGIGRASALSLAKHGHKLFLLCRNALLADELCEEILAIEGAQTPVVLIADLSKPEQVRAACQSLLDRGLPLHCLINNAGIVSTQRKVVSINGTELEHMFAVNHLGHFLLTQLLLPLLVESSQQCGCASRIIIVSSEAHAIFCKGIDFDNLAAEKSFSTFPTYGVSKLANLLMMHQLVQQVDEQYIQVNALHPGAVRSNLGSNGSWYEPIVKMLLAPFFIKPEQGAATTVYLATQTIDTQGVYYRKCIPCRMKPWAKDDAVAKQLWDYSCKVLNLTVQ